MTKLPIILNNFIEKKMQDEIEDIIFDCLWEFNIDNTLGLKPDKYRKFLNPFEYDIAPLFCANIKSRLNFNVYQKIIPLVEKSCKKINFKIEKVERCFAGVHALIKNKKKHDNIHLNREVPHLVMLYYVNDSDGDTILYDKTLDDIPFGITYPDEFCDLNVVKKITPQRGKVLFFDGKVYHASSTPTKSMRCIITLDLFGEFKDGSYKFPAPKEIKKNNFIYQ